jgi:hypothetical protein
MSAINWTKYGALKREDFRCRHTGKEGMNATTLGKLQLLAESLPPGIMLVPTSGFRDKTHPVEVSKTTTGAHVTGRAVDLRVRSGGVIYTIIQYAMAIGFTGIGVKNHGGAWLLHLDDIPAPGTPAQPRPSTWTYR